MIALDTNLLARLVLGDDAAQMERVAMMLESENTFFVPISVSLELAWVLGSQGVAKSDIVDAIKSLRGLSKVRWQEGDALDHALKLATAGLDMADALHLALSKGCDSLQTFDAKFTARAQLQNTQPVVILA